MRPAVRLYRSTVGKKVVMAVSGLVLFGFLLMHMYGNLKAFQGPAAINAYAEHLRTIGQPLLGRGQLLWLVRIILLVSLVAHVAAATQLTLLARSARPVLYRMAPRLEQSYASRTMRWGGVIIFLYAVYHLMHFTWGNAHASFIPGDVYHNLVTGFQAWPITVVYVAATGVVGLHLYHGVWSALQSMGINHPRYNRHRRTAAAVLAGLVTVGFVAVPVSVVAGVLR
ncbi:MAG TPA: succinate dehydrogenase cytochrome b subunit [Gemmatimonadales bacterium]|nr:succinate dehydrogenase cytochrome b subunit [Gemmatimonadales bacterium]